VEASIFDDVLEQVCHRFRALRLGPPDDDGTDVGPLVSPDQLARVESYVDRARSDGVTVATGGGRPAGLEQGYFFEPTVLVDVHPQMTIMQEEVFGPVVCIAPFCGEEEAFELANSVAYGLTASVWTTDLTRAHTTARRLQTGYVWINDVARHYFGMPFGGMKGSGIGREESAEEILGYCELQSVNIRFGVP
jgi:2-formylbenzoate dehydrogenase